MLPGRDTAILGRVIHIAAVADAASDTRLVRVEIPNKIGLPAGCQVTVSFGAKPDASASGSDTSGGGEAAGDDAEVSASSGVSEVEEF